MTHKLTRSISSHLISLTQTFLKARELQSAELVVTGLTHGELLASNFELPKYRQAGRAKDFSRAQRYQ